MILHISTVFCAIPVNDCRASGLLLTVSLYISSLSEKSCKLEAVNIQTVSVYKFLSYLNVTHCYIPLPIYSLRRPTSSCIKNRLFSNPLQRTQPVYQKQQTPHWKRKQWRHDTATCREKEAALLRPEYSCQFLGLLKLVGVYVLYSGDASSQGGKDVDYDVLFILSSET